MTSKSVAILEHTSNALACRLTRGQSSLTFYCACGWDKIFERVYDFNILVALIFVPLPNFSQTIIIFSIIFMNAANRPVCFYKSLTLSGKYRIQRIFFNETFQLLVSIVYFIQLTLGVFYTSPCVKLNSQVSVGYLSF